ncbi:MAG: TonB C-terminal domain-containing protein [Rhodospirillaceae bacterium]|nr:TonB C-terminal domain-containing protein [Rhodospirillaceae bacterium]
MAQSDRDRTAARTPEGVKAAARSLPMTLSEIEAVRRQIQPCWNFPAGAQDAGSLRVLIRIWLNRDGSVRDAKVLDQGRLAGNSKLRAAADAGLRAVNNPRCSPLRLPPEKFDRWKVLTIDFDPSKLKSG